MKLLDPFRQNDRPPCECDWCTYSRLRRSMTWTVRVFPRAATLLGVATFLVVGSVGLVTSCEHDSMRTERWKIADGQLKASTCDETFVVDVGGITRCRPGSHVEVMPAGLGSRQVIVCRCAPAAAPERPQE